MTDTKAKRLIKQMLSRLAEQVSDLRQTAETTLIKSKRVEEKIEEMRSTLEAIEDLQSLAKREKNE